MLADEVDVVVGVDTHRDRHALAVVAAATGAVLEQSFVSACAAGYAEALALVERLAPGARCWAVEGSGAYGAGLVRVLLAAGERVLEVDRARRDGERRGDKSDPLDAVRVARTALGRARAASPRAGAQREALRVLMVARKSAVGSRRRALAQIRSLLVTAPEPLRARLRGLGGAALVRACAGLRAGPRADAALVGTMTALRALARRVGAATAEARAHERAMAALVRAVCPELLLEYGVGPVCAAQLLISWSHKDRLSGEAAFARLAAAAPVLAASGQVERRRLDRGNDRQLNWALHTILLNRLRRDERTRAYVARRMSEGKSTRDAVRCLKRYLARHLFRLMQDTALPGLA